MELKRLRKTVLMMWMKKVVMKKVGIVYGEWKELGWPWRGIPSPSPL